ncbi:MAG: D-alanyl-D-alanine carboxypeptidase, partial [Clostridia bacterium]|nr:D-alanyl-D-alanine carboxypeptidase [Clostridia bacterium]
MYKKFCLFFSITFSIVLLIFSSSITCFKHAYASTKEYSAKAMILIDHKSGQILFEKNSTDKLPIASIVKLMTINLTCKQLEDGKIRLDDKVVASKKAASMGGSQVFIEEGTEYCIGDLLKSVIVSSANDASVLLAEKIAGSEENFVNMMNAEAKRLGLDNTNYSNCTGLPATNQFSCAKDCAVLLKEVSSYENYHRYSTIWMDKLKHNNNRETELVNTNKLIRYYEGCDGGKTGSTSEAGYCLAATAKRANLRLIAVVLGAENGKARFAETSNLLNYGFSNYENKQIISKNYLENDLIKILNGRSSYVNIQPKEEIFVLTKKTEDSDDISTKLVISQDIQAPIKQGDKLGEILVIKNSEIIAKTDIVSMDDV